MLGHTKELVWQVREGEAGSLECGNFPVIPVDERGSAVFKVLQLTVRLNAEPRPSQCLTDQQGKDLHASDTARIKQKRPSNKRCCIFC